MKTRDVQETFDARAKRDPAFRAALLREAVGEFVDGEFEVAKALLRTAIKGSGGYARLSARVNLPEKSLIRMFGPSGNPTAKNLKLVIDALRKQAGLKLVLSASTGPSRRAA
jgi:DNA-binding phage protein